MKIALLGCGAIARFHLDGIQEHAADMRLPLFQWSQHHVAPLLEPQMQDTMNEMWCQHEDISEIQAWCRAEGHRP